MTIAQIGAVLETFDLRVVEWATDPRNHDAIQNRYPGKAPSVGQIRAALVDIAEKFAKARAAAEAPRPRPFTPTAIRRGPGVRANVKVDPRAPQFPMVAQLVSSGELAEEDFMHNADGSISIALNIFETLRSPRYGGAKRVGEAIKSDADLRAYYGRLEAEHAKALRGEHRDNAND